jgi:hypothetical protein
MEFRRQTPMSNQPSSTHTAPPAAAHIPHNPTKARGRGAMKMPPGRLLLWLVVLVVLAAAVGTATYYINRYHDSQAQVKKLAANPTITAQQEQQQLISKIGTLTNLPKGEKPTVATVTDVTKLKSQPFFTNAQNGDRVLIYTQAKQAFLYRPSTNKIINIAPVNLGNNTGTSSTTTTPKSTTTH